MKRVIITNLPLQPMKNKVRYTIDNRFLKNDNEVLFPINSVLEKVMQKGDEVKVVLISTKDSNSCAKDNEDLFKAELDSINSDISANISYEVIENEYEFTNGCYENLFLQLKDSLIEDANLYMDVTFGPKPLMMILFNVAKYAERYLGINIESILYGKVEFNVESKNSIKGSKGYIYELATLYFFNNIMGNMYCEKYKADKMISNLFSLK